jgi:hypothetical protein
MDNKFQHFMDLIKLGIVYLVKLHPLMNNVKLIVLAYIYPYLKMSNKFYYLNIHQNRDGI